MRLFFVPVGLAVLSGCPIDSSPDAAVNVDPLSAHCAATWQAQCEWRQRCGVQSTQVPCEPLLLDCAELFRPSVDAGAMRFDPDASSACVAQWAVQSCQPTRSWVPFAPEPCASVFVGVAREGERCGRCAPGLVCNWNPNAVPFICSVCVPNTTPPFRYPVGGERCTLPEVDGSGCAGGFECLWIDGGAFCDALAPLGESCVSRRCDFGAQCAHDDGGATCQPWRELGEPCGEQDGCKSGLICTGGQCGRARVLGEACSSWVDCASLRCENGACVLPRVDVGESCATAGCLSGAYCAMNSICTARVARGASCSDDHCELGSLCVAGICRNPSIDCR